MASAPIPESDATTAAAPSFDRGLRVAAWVLWSGLALLPAALLLVALLWETGDELELPQTMATALIVNGVIVGCLSFGLARLLPAFLVRRGILRPARSASALIVLVLCLLGWVLADSIAIYGLVLFALSERLLLLLPFLAASWLVLGLTRPRDWSALAPEARD
jgi:hypothetical protein